MRKVLFIDNTAHHLYGQLHLMTALRKSGYQVVYCCPDDGNYFNKISASGFVATSIKINIRSRNPLKEIVLFLKYYRIFRRLRPDLVCGFTIKPNLYGAIAARNLKIPFIASVTGLGYSFMRDNWLKVIVINLYQFAFKEVAAILFQNATDKDMFLRYNIIASQSMVRVLPGDGVDINRFYYTGLREFTHDCRFIFSGRLLWDKGLGDLVNAFRLVKAKYPESVLWIIGNYFPENPAAISENQIKEWQEEGIICYLGMVDNVPQVLENCDCLVLTSYREGMPRSLLEACSMGKPIISVKTPGCSEVIIDGYNGYVAEVGNISSIAAVMTKFIESSHDVRLQMGLSGRKLMEQRFNQTKVIDEFITLVCQLIEK